MKPIEKSFANGFWPAHGIQFKGLSVKPYYGEIKVVARYFVEGKHYVAFWSGESMDGFWRWLSKLPEHHEKKATLDKFHYEG